jgi:hypothetical protein
MSSWKGLSTVRNRHSVIIAPIVEARVTTLPGVAQRAAAIARRSERPCVRSTCLSVRIIDSEIYKLTYTGGSMSKKLARYALLVAAVVMISGCVRSTWYYTTSQSTEHGTCGGWESVTGVVDDGRMQAYIFAVPIDRAVRFLLSFRFEDDQALAISNPTIVVDGLSESPVELRLAEATYPKDKPGTPLSSGYQHKPTPHVRYLTLSTDLHVPLRPYKFTVRAPGFVVDQKSYPSRAFEFRLEHKTSVDVCEGA